MKEINEIVDRVSGFGPTDRAILATVVDVQGSGYRLPGARMLMLENGETFGMVSGGCLEADVLERAKKVLASDRPEVFTYDTTKDAESVFSLNMGCRGVVRIMLEPIHRESWILGALTDVRQRRTPSTIATLIASHAANDPIIGGRAVFGENGFRFDRLDPFLAESDELRKTVEDFHQSGQKFGFSEIPTADGTFELALERLDPPVSLLLFGAGADAVPLVKIASQLGWRSTVFDHRPAYLTHERFGEAEELVHYNDEKPITLAPGDSRTVAVIMTHNYQHDLKILPLLLRSGVACVAALGPKRRTSQLLEESGESFTDEQLSRLYAPAGLDIGAETPEAIALSIVAEIQSVLADRKGGHLRNRDGSIYDRR